MPSAAAHAFQHLHDLVRSLAVNAVADELRVPENCVERRAQLMAHVGEELRLVLARYFQLAALLLDLSEQTRVLDRERELCGERLQQLNGFSGVLARRLARHGEAAKDPSLAQQRQSQHGP